MAADNMKSPSVANADAPKPAAAPDLEQRIMNAIKNEYGRLVADLAYARSYATSLETQVAAKFHKYEVVIIAAVAFLAGVGAGYFL